MSMMDTFLPLLLGRFNNAEQAAELQKTDPRFPFAEHVNTACNDKIAHLPAGFTGVFVVEESYYTVQGSTHASPHLFLFSPAEEGVLLTSYDLPAGCDKTTFTAENMPVVEYDSLVPSGKFTPALYREKDGVWEGGSVSMFTPVLRFTLQERFSPDCLEVQETMEVNGRRTFGYDVPILYRRVL